MASPNPLQRTTPIIHLPLLIFAALFLGPMIWLFATSLMPREQVGRVPPQLFPHQYYITQDAQRIYRTADAEEAKHGEPRDLTQSVHQRACSVEHPEQRHAADAVRPERRQRPDQRDGRVRQHHMRR